MAKHKQKFFKTAEEKHKENVILKCKICGKKMKGKTTLSRHISHAHNDLDPVDREKIVIDTYFGKDKVDKIIRQVKAGVYKDKAVPIDIGRYLRLADIKWEHDDDEKKIDHVKFNSDKNKKSNQDNEISSDKMLVQVRDLAKEEFHDKKSDEEIFYIDNIEPKNDGEKCLITTTTGKTTSLSYDQIVKYIKEQKLQDSILFVSIDEEEYPVVSVEVKKDDEVAGNQIKCVVAYSTTDKKEKEK